MITAVKRYGGYVRVSKKEEIVEAIPLIGQQMGNLIVKICEEEYVKSISVRLPIIKEACQERDRNILPLDFDIDTRAKILEAADKATDELGINKY